MVGHDRRIILPPAAQDKALRGLMSVHLKGHGKFRPHFRLHAKKLQHMGIRRRLLRPFCRKPSLHRIAVHPVRFLFI